MRLALAILTISCTGGLAQQTPSAREIMQRLAENMDRARAARAQYVFDENVFVRLKRANGKLAREESRRYVIAPGDKGARRKLINIEGKVLQGRKEIAYSDPKFRVKKIDIDGELTDDFAHDLLWRGNQNQPMADWFPLHKQDLERYDFHLEGEERYREYDVYRISFTRRGEDLDHWTGEALVERSEFQPVLITSFWAGKIPAAVTIMLGTSVKQIGAKITYRRFDKDVWFPIACGGEIRFRVLFMYARTVAFSATCDSFRKTDVQSSIQFEGEAEP